MNPLLDRRTFLGGVAGTLGGFGLLRDVAAQPRGATFNLPADLTAFNTLSVVLGRPTDRSLTLSAVARERMDAYFEVGTEPGRYTRTTDRRELQAGGPLEVTLDDLRPNTAYYYRLQSRRVGKRAFQARAEQRFHTQRAPESSFKFCVQGDSHPERPQMSEPNLYARTLQHAAGSQPDFYVCMGDDFSVARVRDVNATTLAAPYLLQRPFRGLIGQTAPIFLVNGNHEQASLFNYNQIDVRRQVAIGVQNARNRLYPMPESGRFYTGDTEPLESIGQLKDYYAWTWGDALFVVLDNYWHSPVQVDTGFGSGMGGQADPRNREWWRIGLGDAQYQWFKRTLEQSNARYKFVFAHHVHGTGRGGIEQSQYYEWGGNSRNDRNDFRANRPRWEMPIHQLMARHNVSIFFQGHDHLYCKQERDNIVYQECPIPADHAYQSLNFDAYTSGVKHPNSGYLRVNVTPQRVTVEYVRCYLQRDENGQRRTGDIAHSYTVEPPAARR